MSSKYKALWGTKTSYAPHREKDQNAVLRMLLDPQVVDTWWSACHQLAYFFKLAEAHTGLTLTFFYSVNCLKQSTTSLLVGRWHSEMHLVTLRQF